MLGLALTAVSAAAAVAAGYQSMAPTGQWYGQTFTGLPRGSRQIALTYDDGPNDPHTLRLAGSAGEARVRATFFLIGRYVQQRPEIVREIVQAGHIVGNHTFTHPLLIFKSEAEIRREISQCRAALQDAIGEHSNLFRPPFGGRRPAVLRMARELGLEPVMWNVTGYDWNAPPAAVIERKVAKQDSRRRRDPVARWRAQTDGRGSVADSDRDGSADYALQVRRIRVRDDSADDGKASCGAGSSDPASARRAAVFADSSEH